VGFSSLEGDVRRRWKRVAQLAIDSDELRSLRLAIALVCEAPQDAEARERMRAIAADHRAWEQLAPLLAAEVRLTRDPDVVAALDEESARARSQIEFPPPPMPTLREAIEHEPDNPEHLEMLAWSYYLAGVWTKAAEVLEELAGKVPSEHAILPLHAAARLYRNTGHTQRAQTTYRAIVVRKPSNTEALIAISELVSDTPGLNHTSPFDPPVSDEVMESAVVMADVAARTATGDITAPEVEPEPEPEPEPPKPRKRVQVFDRIDEAELDARFASVFGEAGEPESELDEVPSAEHARSGSPSPPIDDDEPEVTVEPDPVEPVRAVPAEARPIAAIRLQTARVPRLNADGTPAARPRAATPVPELEVIERDERQAPPPLPRVVTPPPTPHVPRESPSKQIIAVDELELAIDRSTLAEDAPGSKAIEIAIEQAMEVAVDAAMDIAMEDLMPYDEPLDAETDAAIGDALDVAFDQATDKSSRNGRPEIAIPRDITREPSIGIVPPELEHDIAAAKADARAGRIAGAEHRLRALLVARPLETAVHVSLVDLLRANNRLADADRHLRETLEHAPAEASGHRAALLHRHALVTSARGDGEQAHAMLREAHELAPMSLPITIALGESYFAREAWGEASRHLGPIANHPDVANHSRAAARGLVTAAVAETRLRRPNQATSHYQAALRIDPGCEAARRALESE
jgi:tetratricopeptide (TPR) repeat protein